MKKIIILFSGRASNLENILNTMHNKTVQITATITNNPQAQGITISQAHSVPCTVIDEKQHPTKTAYNQALLQTMQAHPCDLVVLAGYMRILPSFLIEAYNHTPIINLHPSLLPRHKGLNAGQKSYEDEHAFGGVSVHFVNEKLDDGENIMQLEIDKSQTSTLEEYERVLKEREFEVLPKSILRVLQIKH